MPRNGEDGNAHRKEAGEEKGARREVMRKAKPFSQSRITHHAAGHARFAIPPAWRIR
jgi:hypothetical protein